jgi:hypothetical protein
MFRTGWDFGAGGDEATGDVRNDFLGTKNRNRAAGF